MYSPRIYTYKITFEEVPYYYYGVHKEKYFDEKYWGTPVTHKWCWEFYTPKKQILEIFDYTDEGWLEAQEVERRLIRPVFNTDKWCLNEVCGGVISFLTLSEGGKMGGATNAKNKTGVCGRSKEKMIEDGKKGAKKVVELAIGIHSLTPEQRMENGRKSGKIQYKNKIGIHALTTNQRKQNGKKSYQLGMGIASLNKDEMSKNGRKGGKIGGKISGKNVGNQKWECLETGYISNPGGLSRYQKARGIDTTKRKRIS
jgi:hypothetical protein